MQRIIERRRQIKSETWEDCVPDHSVGSLAAELYVVTAGAFLPITRPEVSVFAAASNHLKFVVQGLLYDRVNGRFKELGQIVLRPS